MNWKGRKVLILCQHGNSRSVALGWMLKRTYQADAICAGLEANGTETLIMLCEWADTIIVVDATLSDMIPGEYAPKLKVWDVGPDVFFRGFKRELLQKFAGYLEAA